MNEIKKWYAVHTHPGRVKKVTEILRRKKIEYYCPLNKIVQEWGSYKKLTQKPLFNSYLFVKIPEDKIPELKATDEVISFLFWLGEPAVIPDAEIETIKQFLDRYSTVRLEKTDVHINYTSSVPDYRFIMSGSSHFENGNHTVNTNNKIFRAGLPSLGYLMIGEVENVNLKVEPPLLMKLGRNWMQMEQKIFRSSKLLLKTLLRP